MVAKTLEERNNIVDRFYEKIAEEGWLDYLFDLKMDSETGFVTIKCTFLKKKKEFVSETGLHM